MRRGNLRLFFLSCALMVSGLAASSLYAAEKAPFYQNKTLTFVINFAAGGPTDIESRIYAKHLSKHIPGKPAVIVQAMGGGGGLIAVNYVGEVAKPDGLTAAYFTGSLFQPRFEVGEAGELLFQRASQTPPEIVSFLRKYIEDGNR